MMPTRIHRTAQRRRRPATFSLARAAAIQSFCGDPSHPRTLLRKAELHRYFPTLFQAGLPAGYYVDATGSQPILGHIRVDVGLDEVGRIVSRCHKLVRRHQRVPGFRQLMAAGQFEITYLIATDEKARRLSLAFSSVAKTGVRCVAIAVPILLGRLVPLPAT